MQKDFTLLRQAGVKPQILNEMAGGHGLLQPKKETLQRIMQFAAAYRCEQVGERLTGIMLN